MPGTTAFPGALDSFPEILPNTQEDEAGLEHDVIHNNKFAAVLALQTKVGIDGSADTSSLDYKVAARIPTSEKGAANGVATLGADSKIPGAQLPALALTDVHVVASQAAQLALTAEEGDVAVRSDLSKSYVHNGGTSGTMSDWTELLTPTDAVLSVAGRTGAVVLAAADIASGVLDPARVASGSLTAGHVATVQGDGTLAFAAPTGGGGSGDVATDTIWNAAGDLAVGTGADTAARLAAGAEGTVLTIVSGVPAWATPTGGGGGGDDVLTWLGL